MLPFLTFFLIKFFFFLDKLLDGRGILVKMIELINPEMTMIASDLLGVEILHVVFDGEE